VSDEGVLSAGVLCVGWRRLYYVLLVNRIRDSFDQKNCEFKINFTEIRADSHI